MNEVIVKEKEAKTGPGLLAAEDAGHRFGVWGGRMMGLGLDRRSFPR